MSKKLLTTALAISLTTGLMAQSISGMSPGVGNQGQTLPIIISGQNSSFHQGIGAMYLSQGTYTIGQGSSTGFTNITIVNPTTISATLSIPANANLGFYDLLVPRTGTSTLNKFMAFEVRQPSGSQVVVSPNGGQPGKTVNATFTVSGATFKSSTQQTIEKVWLSMNGEIITDISNIQVVNATTFTADVAIPAGATEGLWNVNVYADDKVMYSANHGFEVDNTFSRQEYANTHFKLYPNPVSDVLTATFDIHLSNLDVQITTLDGKVVSPYSYKVSVEEKSVKVNLENLPKGVYMVQFTSNSEVIASKKILRQ